MNLQRKSTLCSVLKGLLAGLAAAVTGVLLLSALVVLLGIPDGLLRALNQVLKAVSVITAARVAVGRGGTRGFLTGLAVAALFMALGYGVYALLSGCAFDTLTMLGEIMLGATLGAVAGAVFANLQPKHVRRRTV